MGMAAFSKLFYKSSIAIILRRCKRAAEKCFKNFLKLSPLSCADQTLAINIKDRSASFSNRCKVKLRRSLRLMPDHLIEWKNQVFVLSILIPNRQLGLPRPYFFLLQGQACRIYSLIAGNYQKSSLELF